MCACLSLKWVSKSTFTFDFSSLCDFVRVWLKGAENSSEHRESWRALLSFKCASKSMIKF